MKRDLQVSIVSGKGASALSMVMAGVCLLVAAGAAHAGGLSSANTAATNFNTAWFIFLATVAITYLSYVGVKCWGGHSDWVRDFGGACVQVAVVGSIASVLGPYLWTLFTS